MTNLQPDDPDFGAKYAAELRELCRKQDATIANLTAVVENHNAVNREAIRQRDEARADRDRLREQLGKIEDEHDRATDELIAERDLRIRQIDDIADALGDEGEWSNLHDRGDTAIELANQQTLELERLRALINTPRTDDFFESVRIEAAHQIERWGVEHDAGKRPEDWITLYMYLLGKAAKAHFDGDRAKLLHHVITVAAVALNWHRNATGENTLMRPGVAPKETDDAA